MLMLIASDNGPGLRLLSFPYRSIPFPAFSVDRRPYCHHAARSQDLPDCFHSTWASATCRWFPSSMSQRRPVPDPNLAGRSTTESRSHLHGGTAEARASYLAFLGRISPEKRPDRAISIARALGIPLKIAAKVDRVDEVYFKTQIEPLLQGGGVEFIGEINDREKTQFLGDAQALLFPVDWPEPFGLSMIEAMACGTPVLAFRCGSVRRSSRMASQALLSAPWKRRSRPCRASLPSIEKRYVNASNSAFPPHEWRKTMSVYIGRYWRYPPSVSSRILCFRQAARI